MVNLILEINSKINEFVWGPAMIVAIVGVGIYLTLGTGFVQFIPLRRKPRPWAGRNAKEKLLWGMSLQGQVIQFVRG